MSNNPQHVMRCQRRKKLDVVEKFGGKCQKCGYDRCINALEFHHLGEKKESPSYVIMRWKWEKAKKELEKCIMLCANCHREVHFKEMDSDVFIPAPMPWRTHACPVCEEFYDTKNENQRYCSQVCAKQDQSKDKPDKERLRLLIRTHPQRTVAKMLKVGSTTIKKWCLNYGIDPAEGCKSHRNPMVIARRENRLNRVKKNPRKLTIEQAREAMKAVEKGEESLRVISRRYGVHHTTLIDIQKGRIYKELQAEFPNLISPKSGRQRPYAKITLRSAESVSQDLDSVVLDEVATTSASTIFTVEGSASNRVS